MASIRAVVFDLDDTLYPEREYAFSGFAAVATAFQDRLGDPEELLFLGIEDMLQPDAVLLVEWPERGRGVLPAPDLSIEIRHGAQERRLTLQAGTEKGSKIINNLHGVWHQV